MSAFLLLWWVMNIGFCAFYFNIHIFCLAARLLQVFSWILGRDKVREREKREWEGRGNLGRPFCLQIQCSIIF